MKCWFHVRWEPQMSTKQVITQVPWALSENMKRDLPGCVWFVCTRVCLLFPSLSPPTFSFLLTFTLEDDTERNRDLSLKYCVTCNLSCIANTQKLSADWQSIHYLLNLSACVIFVKPLLQKSHPSLTLAAVSAAIFLQELEERKRMKSISLGISGFDNISISWLAPENFFKILKS